MEPRLANPFNLKIPKQRPYVLASSGVAVSCPADTTEDILATITVPGGAMGANGAVRMIVNWSLNSLGFGKTLRVRFGGVAGNKFYEVTTTAANLSYSSQVLIKNKNSTNSQIGATPNFGAFGAALPVSALETQNPQDIVITGQKFLAGDTLTLESYIVEIL